MAQALAKLRIQPSGSPGFWQVQATIYDTVTQTYETVSVQLGDAVVRNDAALKAQMDLNFGAIDYTIAAPPTP